MFINHKHCKSISYVMDIKCMSRLTNEYECDNTKLNSHETFKTHKL